MNRDYDLEEKFFKYLEALDFEDARNAALPVFDIINALDESPANFDDD